LSDSEIYETGHFIFFPKIAIRIENKKAGSPEKMYNPNFEFYYQVLYAIQEKHFVKNKKPPEKVGKLEYFLIITKINKCSF
jgi:hypothetical protein